MTAGNLAGIRIGVQIALTVLTDGTVGAVGTEREGRVLSGAGFHVVERTGLTYRVKTVEMAVDTLEIVTCHGDFGVAHAVADEQDDILGGLVADCCDALCAAMLGQFGHGFAVRTVGGCAVSERRYGERAKRGDGGERRDGALKSLVLAHVFFFLLHAEPFRALMLRNLTFPSPTLSMQNQRSSIRTLTADEF